MPPVEGHSLREGGRFEVVTLVASGPRMQIRNHTSFQFIAVVAVLYSPWSARAEGTSELGTSQALRAGTTLAVDILHETSESMIWTGAVRSW